jgi:uncharacterized protein YihD (DUF1040 family)
VREIDRIDRILNIISKLWHLMPDLRLGQLLYNFAGFGDKEYYIEDDITEEKLLASLRKWNIE